MNQRAILDPDAPDATRRTMGVAVGVVVLGLAAALVVAFVAGLSGGPATIARITFENPTDYALGIEVRPASDTSWTSAGSVAQRATAVVEEVVDQGAAWVFRFDSQGRSGGELRLSRSELEASGWRVTVPVDVGRHLADSGAPPTP